MDGRQMRFDNQQIVISGAAKGLGRHYALALAQRGATLILIDELSVNAPEVIELVLKIKALGSQAHYFEQSFLALTQADELVSKIVAISPHIDVLINGASLDYYSDFNQLDPAKWQQQWQTTVNFSLLLTHGLWPVMKAQDYGRVLMLTNISGLYGSDHSVALSSANMALLGMVNSLAIEGEQSNIHVNSLCALAVTEVPEKHLAARVRPIFGTETPIAAMLFLVSTRAPSGQHLLAAAGSISRGTFAEYASEYFFAEECTPEIIASRWRHPKTCRLLEVHTSAESKISAWSFRGAKEHNIKLV
ncbi:SDR family oxidoreductase [Shewanella sp. SNU WT4]|uniref:SDR family NAD(P)-dependent oxidoreductase n=1 Tax=Shewanella sp. SNU WT4 TaxID=2590015 RepID=UPI00143DD4C4|nr:SDR family oxidoreductase [Shewanella sp. SNU WT4]